MTPKKSGSSVPKSARDLPSRSENINNAPRASNNPSYDPEKTGERDITGEKDVDLLKSTDSNALVEAPAVKIPEITLSPSHEESQDNTSPQEIQQTN